MSRLFFTHRRGGNMSVTIMEARGHNGQVELTDSILRIKRRGVLAFMTQGLKGDKEILISQISSIQFKKANVFTNGYIQFPLSAARRRREGCFREHKTRIPSCSEPVSKQPSRGCEMSFKGE
jgi:hypothetical protein